MSRNSPCSRYAQSLSIDGKLIEGMKSQSVASNKAVSNHGSACRCRGHASRMQMQSLMFFLNHITVSLARHLFSFVFFFFCKSHHGQPGTIFVPFFMAGSCGTHGGEQKTRQWTADRPRCSDTIAGLCVDVVVKGTRLRVEFGCMSRLVFQVFIWINNNRQFESLIYIVT